MPAAQVVPFLQAFAQLPQLSGSLFRSTHAPLHDERPVEHEAAQAPLLQRGVAPEHLVPHAPQFEGSFASFAHVPEQSFVPAGQTHAPALQFCVEPHASPHVPQFSALDVVSTHAFEQSESGAEQLPPHCPRSHTWPCWHVTLHAPQCAGSLASSAQSAPHWT